MTNAKSTLAVTAIILGGLVAASPFPYPRAPEARPQRVVQAVAPDLVEPASAGDWVDPPAKSLAEAPTQSLARSETPAVIEAAAATVPDTVPDMQTPVAAAEAPPPAQPATSKPVDRAAAKLAAKRAEQAKRRRLAQAAARRQAASKQAAAPEEQTVASAAPAAAPADPITSLLRGLGFGRQG